MLKSTTISGLLMLTGLALPQPPVATTSTQVNPFKGTARTSQAASPIRGYAVPQTRSIRSGDVFAPAVSRVSSFVSNHEAERMGTQEVELLKGVNLAISKIAADDGAVREAGMKDLESSLDKLFDVRTSSREAQIADLETRLKKLRDQLEERKNRKTEIVDLRLQTILNEANGLSF